MCKCSCTPCVDCGEATSGTRCRPCADAHRTDDTRYIRVCADCGDERKVTYAPKPGQVCRPCSSKRRRAARREHVRVCPDCGDKRSVTYSLTVTRRCWPCAMRQVHAERAETRTTAEPDHVVVDRLAGGVKVQSTLTERLTATTALGRMGMSASQIAARLHVSARTVERYRVELRKAA